MSGPSIPDRAASLVNLIAQAKERIGDARRAGGDWTSLQLMLDEAEAVAASGLQHAGNIALRMHSLADTECKRIEDSQE